MQRDINLFGTSIRFLATAEETGGRGCVMLVTYPPGAAEIAPHINHDDGEHWLVLDGTIAFEVDGAARTLGAGESIQFAAGATHRGGNPGSTPATALVAAMPGLKVHEWMSAIAVLESADPAAFEAINTRYGVSVIAPSPAQ